MALNSLSMLYSDTTVFKLEPNRGIRYLNDEDVLFLEKVITDLDSFISSRQSVNSVLLFPPLNNWRRFLIHHTVCDSYAVKHQLSSLSVGEGAARRIAVCDSSLKKDDPAESKSKQSPLSSIQLVPQSEASKTQSLQSTSSEKAANSLTAPSLASSSRKAAMNIYTPPHLRRMNGGGSEGGERRLLTSSENLERRCKTEPPSKVNRTRRPDMKVYVPRALRSSLPSSTSETNDQTVRSLQISSANNTPSFQSANSDPSRGINTNSGHTRTALRHKADIPSLPANTSLSNNMEQDRPSLSSHVPLEIPVHPNQLVTKDRQGLRSAQDLQESLNLPENAQQNLSNLENAHPEMKDIHITCELNTRDSCTTNETSLGVNAIDGATHVNMDHNSHEIDNDDKMDTSEDLIQESKIKNGSSDPTAKFDNTQVSTPKAEESGGLESEIVHSRKNFNESNTQSVPPDDFMECEHSINECPEDVSKESNVPSSQDNTNDIGNNITEVSKGNEPCTVMKVTDGSGEVPNKVRLIETLPVKNDSFSNNTKEETMSESTLSQSNATKQDTISNPVSDALCSLCDKITQAPIADCELSESAPHTSVNNSNKTIAPAEPMLSESSKPAAESQLPESTSSKQPESEVKLILDSKCVESASGSIDDSASTIAPVSVPESPIESKAPLISHSPTEKVSAESVISKPISEVKSVQSAADPAISKPVSEKSDVSSPITSSKSTGSCTPTKPAPAKSTVPPVNLNPDECDWETLYDDDGECLIPDIMNELMNKMGKVSVQTPTQEYRNFQTPEERSCDGENILEIYGFSSTLTNRDLMDVFAAYSRTFFHIKWVDDTHALGVFASPLVADEVLNTNLPNVKTRPLKEATALSKAKAKTLNLISTPLPRPKTCLSSARRLVSGALGIRVQVSETKREEERQMLRDAREKKRQEARQRQDIWEKD
ncbi:hypothetical protein M8J76_008516 [Diaphorina citri]|nr:hypothetical protein M8J76_008516 [Diaphorina citri]